MRLLVPSVLLTVLLVSCGGSSVSPVDTAGAAATIRMKTDAFEPTTVTVKKGDKVCWANDDAEARWPASNIHPTHEIYSDFDPKTPVRSGESWCFVFAKPGIWKFHDHLFPELIGTVNVN
jgi:plastocyanin